ncbi:MAG: type II toxin-antitoxin system RatA family toxin [Gammaproteobacteria bacterium]|nr:type II toxin-antitoxin system RatA family toxin [Gammaproteobacteria bacterium]NNM13297.1 type II toxin-antitoxin system RatA family toxin [Gammaproteobacteria bacterium]
MPIVERNALVPYTCAEMFDLVNNFESYPEFLPWCASGELHSSENGQLSASLGIQKGLIKDSFTTSNTNDRPWTIQMQLLDGPFKRLRGQWSFDPLGKAPLGQEAGCKVGLYMDFQFKHGIANLLSRTLQNDISDMMDAFVHRAEHIYGPRSLD